MEYTRVVFFLDEPGGYKQDLMIHALGEAGFDSFEDTETGFHAYIPTLIFHGEAVQETLNRLHDEYDAPFSVEFVEDENWNRVWESNFEPVHIGNDVLVRATFHPHEAGFTHEIVIDPKMAFGTGHHATTALMIRFLLEADVRDKRVLDMGSGTGILAILAAKLGAREIVAIDNDPVCVSSIRENCERNAQPGIQPIGGSSDAIPPRKFDHIIANINRNILLDHLPAYASAAAPGCHLFLSGFYEGDDTIMLIAEAERLGFQYQSVKIDQSWAAVHFIRKA
ncbi:MAG: 50S ribosomal protein L11 methyltransferase [Mucilaginibacter polytrichastri]|nr:50S ribosomal protein L11 methyltransferase [Mucilaginibacter polytrichastri]